MDGELRRGERRAKAYKTADIEQHDAYYEAVLTTMMPMSGPMTA